MALGCLLWISWTLFLLFNGSSGLPAIKGYGYPYKTDSRNIGEGEDEVWNSLSSGSNWQASASQPTDAVYTSYNKPSVAQQPVFVNTPQKLPNALEVEKPVNGDPRDWGLQNLAEPFIFPLKPNYLPSDPAKPQPYPIKPQATSLNAVASNSMKASPSTGGPVHHASLTAYYEPATSYTAQAAKSPSLDSSQADPVSSGYKVTDLGFGSREKAFNTGSSAHGGTLRNIPHLVFEEVFQYPSENTAPSPRYVGTSSSAGGYSQAPYMSEGSPTGYASEPSFPSYPANVGAQPVYTPGKGHLSSRFSGENLRFGQTSYQPHENSPRLPQKPDISTQTLPSQRVSEPILPPSPPIYSMQSRSAYQRGRYVFSESTYSPQFPPPMPVSATGEGLATSQPAAPKGVQNPQRTKW
ncbi:DNA-directed RNA polymerase II subunit RPB1-like [Xiphias gladius]|uniref:DNA-directed RNA polymerase II subunit RPB1-like n=1 Tax=Xiphias gladius TaxID=8245 RepID=UPI001A99655F|nr:DNA-directed RNA polymerase II subunit RPB1-like [Xiphias gladius]XP_039978857.1 DNA-directed RNA polymerase II subunit RPB1-like [Xiphias gladius]